MGKRQRLRKEVSRANPAVETPVVGLKLGGHQFRNFDGLDCAFGARLADYPAYESIPEEFRRGHSKANDVVGTLFFRGGQLSDFGLSLKAGIDPRAFHSALKAMLGSFDPKHEHKKAACAWLVSEYTEAS